jgi:hypothetical protein
MSLFEMNSNDKASTYERVTGEGSQMPFPAEDEVKQLGHAILTEILDCFGKDATEEHAQRIAHYVLGGIQSAINYFDGQYDRAALEMDELNREQDGSEVKDGQLAEATGKARYFEALLMVLETFRDAGADTFHVMTNTVWTPHRGSAKSVTTSFAMMEVAETLRRKAKRDNTGYDPAAQYVVFRGVQSANREEDAKLIYRALDWARQKFPNMHLAVTGNSGAETIATSWAKNKKVTVHLDQLRKKEGNAGPFKCNDRLLSLKPVMVLYMPTPSNPTNEAEAKPNGIVLNIAQKAQESRVLTYRVAQKAEATAQA